MTMKFCEYLVNDKNFDIAEKYETDFIFEPFFSLVNDLSL